MLVKGEGHLAAEGVVHPEAGGGGGKQIQPRPHRLDAQVILLVDHDGQRVLLAQEHRGGLRLLQQILADEPALRQGLALGFRQGI